MDFVLYGGNDRVGKSTMSKSLQHILGNECNGNRRRVARLSFSDSLREELVHFYGIPYSIIFDTSIDKSALFLRLGDYIHNQDIPQLWVEHKLIPWASAYDDTTISLRELFISHGNRIRRMQDPKYWEKHFDTKVNEHRGLYDVIVVDDPRAWEDFEYFADKKTCIYHLTNNRESKPNEAQTTANEWLLKNKDKVERIAVPSPLSMSAADYLNKCRVVPQLLPTKST